MVMKKMNILKNKISSSTRMTTYLKKEKKMNIFKHVLLLLWRVDFTSLYTTGTLKLYPPKQVHNIF